mmetsp:Transcript_2861/g.11380  ORF Transcript_2861/g.11380 Transcript_2861/m.11380 type:complete len:209 (-) Transcript_2861:376-1002(-)
MAETRRRGGRRRRRTERDLDQIGARRGRRRRAARGVHAYRVSVRARERRRRSVLDPAEKQRRSPKRAKRLVAGGDADDGVGPSALSPAAAVDRDPDPNPDPDPAAPAAAAADSASSSAAAAPAVFVAGFVSPGGGSGRALPRGVRGDPGAQILRVQPVLQRGLPPLAASGERGEGRAGAGARGDIRGRPFFARFAQTALHRLRGASRF